MTKPMKCVRCQSECEVDVNCIFYICRSCPKTGGKFSRNDNGDLEEVKNGD